jgi:hypothetical protein
LTPLGTLARNLIAGARLSLALPVRRLSFRIDVAQLLLAFVFSSLIDVAGDWLRYGPHAQFSWLGAGNEIFSFGLLIAAAALVAIARRRASLALALPLIVLAAAPPIQIANVVLAVVTSAADVPQFAASWLAYLVPFWFVAMIMRATWIAFEGEGRRHPLAVLFAGILVASPTWLAPSLFPSLPWWRPASSAADSDVVSSPVATNAQRATAAAFDVEPGGLPQYASISRPLPGASRRNPCIASPNSRPRAPRAPR